MRTFRKFPNLFKFSCLATVSCGAGWLYYQIRTTRHILNNALDTNVLTATEPTATRKGEHDEFYVIHLSQSPFRYDTFFKGSWSALKFALSKRLLVMANADNKYIRRKAVRQLARMRNLDSWHCTLLSQMIDARTAVGLARMPNVDGRLFGDAPYHYVEHTQNMMIDLMRELLVKLHDLSDHPCMGYFISKAFVEVHQMERFVDYEHIELRKYIQSNHEVIPICLESLVHHASIKDYAKDIAQLNGLPLLMEIYNRFKDNVNITATICRIISYMSMQQDLLEDLHKSGWIGVLAQWVKHDDVRISIPATKALANLDTDEDSLYLQRLYPLHPTTRFVRQPQADIVFVHGLLGGVFFTWRQRKREQDVLGLLESLTQEETPSPPVKRRYGDPEMQEIMNDLEEHLNETAYGDYDMVWEDIPTNTNDAAYGPYCCPANKCTGKEDSGTNCWPRDWLAQDCDGLRIIGVNYETNLSMWSPICPVEKVKALDERSDELTEQLVKAGVGKRPIVWVTHSMGGLMVKNLLARAYRSSDKTIRDVCCNTKGLVFYSTPHAGSSAANFNQASALVIWPSIEVQELQLNSPKLIEIHNMFLDVIEKIPMTVVTFVETKPTIVSAMKLKFLIVEPQSGNPGCGEYYEIPLDHLRICKPASRQSFIYQKVLHMIRTILTENKQYTR